MQLVLLVTPGRGRRAGVDSLFVQNEPLETSLLKTFFPLSQSSVQNECTTLWG